MGTRGPAPRSSGLAALFLAGLTALVPVGQALAQPGTWATKAPLLNFHYAGAAGVIDGKFYVVGGHDGLVDKGLEVYDPATNHWTNLATPPTPVRHAPAGVIGGKLYVPGGLYGSQLQVYDPATDTWTFAASMPTFRVAHAAAVIGGKLYVVGGGPGQTDVYDAATDTWMTGAPIPTPRDWLSAAAIGGKLYVVGGDPIQATLEVYDPATDTWTTKAPMPTPRCCLAVGVIDGLLHAVGGQQPGVALGTNEVYNPATDTWSPAAAMPTPRGALVAGVIDSTLYAASGQADSGVTDVVEAYAAPVCVPPPPDLVSWWDGDAVSGSVALDSAGANDGTMVGGVAIVPGRVGNAFAFDGASGHVTVPDSADQRPPAITIAGWINLARAPAPGTSFIAASKYGGSYNGWLFDIDAALRVNFALHRQPGVGVPTVSSVSLPVNAWTHVAGTYDGTTARLYIDGIEQGSMPMPGGYTPSGVPMSIGSASWTSCCLLPGLVDEFTVSSRALTGEEILAIVEAGSKGQCKAPPTVTVVSPDTNAIIQSSPATVTVEASDHAGVAAVSVNGVAASRVSGTARSGTWQAMVPVSLPVAVGGALTFTATATNLSGQAATPATTVVDNDGIPAALDSDSGAFSNAFSDGVTAGLITVRHGWVVQVTDVNPGGVQIGIIGGSGLPSEHVVIDTCPAGDGPERITLNAIGETAEATCVGTSSRVKAVAAFSVIEVVKGGVAYVLPASQEITVGSPATASPDNTLPIAAQVLGADGVVVGTFELDPGESVDVTFPTPGSIQLTVLAGTITVTLGGQTTTLGPGQSQTFQVSATVGRMRGDGRIDVGATRHHFDFDVVARQKGERGRLRYRVHEKRTGRDRTDVFVATAITAIAFSDDPDVRPGGPKRLSVDTVAFSGEGRWNGTPGYTFEARATDAGEPGAGRDRFAITVRAPGGAVVSTVSGLISAGNTQSKRVKR